MAKKYCPICQIHIAEKKYELHLKWHKKNTKGKTFIVNEHGIVDSVQTHNLSRLNSNPFISTDRPKENHYVVCPECNILLKASKLEFHLEQAHSESEPQVGTPNNSELPQDRKKSQFKQFLKGQQPWAIFCPVCDVKLKSQDRLAKHLAKVHSDQMPEQKGTVPVKPAMPAKVQKIKSGTKTDKGIRTDEKYTKEAFHQSFDDSRDGSKGFGHMRRESNGRFGSYPLHDDYSDESDS